MESKKLLKVFKVQIIIIFLLFSCNSLFSNKEISVLYKNPLYDSLQLTHIQYSTVNIFALANESLFRILGSNNYIGVRLVEMLIFYYATAFSSALSHEFSHYRVADYYGLKPKIYLEAFGGLVTYFNPYDKRKTLLIIGGGLTQQEINAEFIYEKIVTSGNIHYHTGINFMMNHLCTLSYSLLTQLGYDKGDINRYNEVSKKLGYNVSTEKIFLLSALTVFTSVVFWQNIILTYDLIANNKRRTKLITFYNFIAPPILYYYLTDYGDFLRISIPFINPIPIFFSVGFGLVENIFRIGIRVYALNTDRIVLIPFGYFSNIPNMKYGGVFGVDVILRVFSKELNLLFNIKYSNNDIIERLRINSGLHISFGLSIVLD